MSKYREGWTKNTIIENGDVTRKRVNCKDCIYYCDDKSCSKRPIYIPDVGYDFWKQCSFFQLDKNVNNYARKFDRLGSDITSKLSYETLLNTVRSKTDVVKMNKTNNWKNISKNLLQIFYTAKDGHKNNINYITTYLLPKEYYESVIWAIEKEKMEPMIYTIAYFINKIDMVPYVNDCKELSKYVLKHVSGKEFRKTLSLGKREYVLSQFIISLKEFIDKKISISGGDVDEKVIESRTINITTVNEKNKQRKVEIGSTVKHIGYGKGTVKSFDGKNVEIKFIKDTKLYKFNLDFLLKEKMLEIL